VVVVGIGHDLRGDDAAGVLAARRLQGYTIGADVGATHMLPLLAIDAGPAPENVTGAVRRFAPDLVLLVDAADLGEPPGTVRWLDWRETSGLSASTHALPLYVLAGYLVSELGCAVALLGIQPASTAFDAPPTPAVHAAADAVAAGLHELLSCHPGDHALPNGTSPAPYTVAE